MLPHLQRSRRLFCRLRLYRRPAARPTSRTRLLWYANTVRKEKTILRTNIPEIREHPICAYGALQCESELPRESMERLRLPFAFPKSDALHVMDEAVHARACQCPETVKSVDRFFRRTGVRKPRLSAWPLSTRYGQRRPPLTRVSGD